MLNRFRQLAIFSSLPCVSRFLSSFNLTLFSSILALALMTSTSTVQAACKGLNCACIPSELQYASPALEPDEDGDYPISLEADNVESQGDEVVILSGNAEVSQGRQTIVGDVLKYYRVSEQLQAEGNVEVITDSGDYIASDSVDVHMPSQVGTLRNAEFKLAESLSSEDGVDTAYIASRGTADVVNLEGEGVIRLEKTRYTTCPEGNRSVFLSARELVLDQNAGVGSARGAVVRFKGVPLVYAPYLTFPINDQRKTGFLTPGFGSDEESGTVFELPWYWNIAKNQDATITPRYYSDRGVQLAAEYRRQTVNSSSYVYGEILPDDDLFGDDRHLLSIIHSQQLSDSLSLGINYNDVSDIDYFSDLSNQARFFSATFVPRDVQLNYVHQYVNITARANEFQIIDDRVSTNNAPFERLPSLSFYTTLPQGPFNLNYGISGSFVDFDTDSETRVTGTRTSLNPYVELPFENIWGYVKPAVSLHTRTYSLDNVAEGGEDSPSFTVPIFSIDSGIAFERNAKWFGDGVLHTLEPRLFYVFAPEEDQDDVPIFDTSQVTLNNFSNIFRTNRFFGEDRVGDTNQVTLGVTSRVLDAETGDERLKFSLGQLVLLDDLELNFRGSGDPIEEGLGDLLTELRTQSGAWSTYTYVQYSHELDEITTARFALGYTPRDDSRKNINIGYYFVNGFTQDLDQLTTSVNWPVSDRWQFFANNRYDLESSESLETTIGLEYNGCCWKARVTGTDRINNRFGRLSASDDEEFKRTAVFFELELTSLGSIGTGF